jgi:DNA (cytosine-5)-methyltransferase 1
MNVIDLFGGVGGFSLGAHLAGFSVPLAIDLDINLTKSRPLNFPNGRVVHANITGLHPLGVLRDAHLKSKDVCGIIGGPPCQGFSAIGARKVDDPRNQLVLEFFRFIKAIKPSFFVLENVPGILLNGNRTLLERGMKNVERGYTFVGPIIVDAADFGAPTRRRRVLLIGYRSDVAPITEADIDGAKSSRITTVFQAIHDLPMPSDATLQEDGEYVAAYRRAPDRGARGAYARRARETPPSGLASPDVRVRAKATGVIGLRRAESRSDSFWFAVSTLSVC